MQRVANLCVITGIFLLAAGILIPYLMPNTGWSLHWRGTGYGFSWQMPCYGLAALFSLFAFLYSISYLPFDKTVAQWHFWLSLGCVMLYASGQGFFYMAMRDGTVPQLGLKGTVIALSFLASVPVFLATQLLFAFELVRAVVKLHPA
jgi:hypothetical protein